MADDPPDDEQPGGDPEDTPLTGWARQEPTGTPPDDIDTPATGWVGRAQDPALGAESETPATGWMWARPASGSAEAEGAAHPDNGEPTAATGWVIAGTGRPAESAPAPSALAHPDPAGGGSVPGWPQAPAIAWAQTPIGAGTQASPVWAAPPRRRSWWLGSLAVAILALLVVAGGGLGFVAASRPAPTPTPRSQPTLQPTVGPIGAVDAPFITLRLPAGWLEQQQSKTDVKLVHFPNGSMDINVHRASAAGESTPQAVLQQAQQRLSHSPDTLGLVSTCVQPAAHTIAGRPGVEEGFQFEQRGNDGKSVFTNCDVAWASVQNGQVYFWEVFDTLDQLQPSTVAATRMQRSAHWQE